jgi:lipoyl(octanoyl) transferase
MFNYLYLGRMDYAQALELQRKLVELRHQNRILNTLLLLEHSPVLTLGRNSQRSNILASDDLLKRRGVEIYEVNRGGDVTYHGPGQLVGYPIFDLRSFTPRLGPVDFVRQMEEVLIRLCGSYRVLTQRIKGRTGVWTLPGGSIAEKKVAAIGIHVSRGIVSHGFALNVTTDLRDFQLIVPCGIQDRDVTSLDLEISSEMALPSLENIAHEVARHFGMVFGQPVLAVASVNSLLGAETTPLLQKFASERSSAERSLEPNDQDFPSGAVPDDTPLQIPPHPNELMGQEKAEWA